MWLDSPRAAHREAGVPARAGGWLPNFGARRQVLVWHDVHHLLTGYPTMWTGEAEIGGFEIATSCKRYWAAWFFNFGGWLFGLVINPRHMFTAFVRGRHGADYYGVDDARVLALPIDAARAELGLLRAVPPATFDDVIAFVGWSLLVVALYVAAPLLAVGFVLGSLCG